MTPTELVAWRAEHHVSQRKLATLLDVTFVTVWRWEKGHSPIPRTTDYALRYLDQELLKGAPDEDNDDDTPAFSDSDRLILELWAEHGDDVRDNAGRAFKAIADFRGVHLERDIDAATAGDKRALIRLRKAMGLPAFKTPALAVVPV